MSKTQELIRECQRLSENCLYTSTSLFIWLRSRRRIRVIFIVTPLILGSAASWKLLTAPDLESVQILASIFAFVAGLMPSVYSALKYDDQLESCARVAAEFKNLQDRFRQVALVSSRKSYADFERDFTELMDRLEQTRAESITPPERYFKAAQKKIKTGDYEFDVDIEETNSNS